MAEARSFTHVCELLERLTRLDRLEARGTVRLALKGAGFEAASVSREQMAVVVEKILPGELGSRGVESPEAVCAELRASLATLPLEATEEPEAPEAIFARLAG
jgi:hypothetical protein